VIFILTNSVYSDSEMPPTEQKSMGEAEGIKLEQKLRMQESVSSPSIEIQMTTKCVLRT
jgi:hypothetical protein